MPTHVGVIFFHAGRLHIDSTPIANALPYGALLTHEKGHPDYWEELQRRGLVPRDVEYDEVARGRISADPRRGTALLTLDRCILNRVSSKSCVAGCPNILMYV